MRRLLSLVLLAAFGMPFVAPLLASAQGPEAALPACCRRTGKHQCAMGILASDTESQTPHWTAHISKCPCCPETGSVVSHRDAAFAASAQHVAFLDFARPAGRAQTESRRRIARERSRHKRGPPYMCFA